MQTVSTNNSLSEREDPLTSILTQFVKRIKVKNAILREQRAQELAHLIATLSRQLNSETYTKLLAHVTPQLFELLQSPHEHEQLGGLSAINLLIEFATEDHIIRFANYLRHFIAQSATPKTQQALLIAAKVLGRLASVNTINGNGISGTLVAACVDFEVKRAFEWLQGDRQEPIFSQRRLAACFVLKELARAAPTLFHVNLNMFFQSIWGPIRDLRVEIRQAATQALSACLELIALRQTRHRVQWYCKVYDQVFAGLEKSNASERGSHREGNALYSNYAPNSISESGTESRSGFKRGATSSGSESASHHSNSLYSHETRLKHSSIGRPMSWEAAHGSLLVIAEMLKNTGGFMIPRFHQVCETVLLYREAKDKLVNRTVCLLLPQLASFCPEAFVRYYLEDTVQHLLKQIETCSPVPSSSSTKAAANASRMGLSCHDGSAISTKKNIAGFGDSINTNHYVGCVVGFSERGIAFFALGQLALAVDKSDMCSYLPAILKLIEESLSPYNVARANNRGTAASEYSTRRNDESVGLGLGGLNRQARYKTKNKLFCIETWDCVANLAQCLGEEMTPYIHDLMEIMLQNELSDILVTALTNIVAYVPSALFMVQERLLNEISISLRGVPFFGNDYDELTLRRQRKIEEQHALTSQRIRLPPESSAKIWEADTLGSGVDRSKSSSSSPSEQKSSSISSWFSALGKLGSALHLDDDGFGASTMEDPSGRSLPTSTTLCKGETHSERDAILLSLKTLSCFDFYGNFSLLPFTKECVALYLQSPDPRIRQQAVFTCTKLLLFSAETKPSRRIYHGTNHDWQRISKRGPSGRVMDTILTRLLQVGLSDTDVNVRLSVLVSFLNASFDDFLCQEQHLNMLLKLLNDEQAVIREHTMQLLDRLAPLNPAFVLPSLRRMLIQLLTELRHAPVPPKDFDLREQSTRLFGQLIRTTQHLVDPYLVPILQVLIPTLLHGSHHTSLASAVLIAVGQLAVVAQRQLEPYVAYLFPIVFQTLQDHGAVDKRQIALQTLGILAGSTGCVVRPYLAFPTLLEKLLALLQHSATTPWQLRREAMKTIGILGALDPYKHKLCLSGSELLANDQDNSKKTCDISYTEKAKGMAHGGRRNNAKIAFKDDSNAWLMQLEVDLKRLGIPVDTAAFERTAHTMDVLDEKQQIEVHLFTAAPVGTRRRLGSARVKGSQSASAGSGDADRNVATSHAPARHSASLPQLYGTDGAEEYISNFDFDGWLASNDHELDPSELSPSSDAYFPTVAIHVLLGILKDPSLGMHHHGVIQAIMFIFKSLSMQCVPFLKYIVPPFLLVLRQSQIKLRETLFLQLTQLIIIVQRHMQPFFPPIVYLALQFWSHHVVEIIRLMEHLAQACSVHEFRNTYLPALLPRIMMELQPPTAVLVGFKDASEQRVPVVAIGQETLGSGATRNTIVGTGTPTIDASLGTNINAPDQTRSALSSSKVGSTSSSAASDHVAVQRLGSALGSVASQRANNAIGNIGRTNDNSLVFTIQTQVVQAIILFREALDDYVYLLIPVLVRLVEHTETALQVKMMIIYAFAKICTVMKVEHYLGSRILQPLARVLSQLETRESIFSRAGTTLSSWANNASSGGGRRSGAGNTTTASSASSAMQTRYKPDQFGGVSPTTVENSGYNGGISSPSASARSLSTNGASISSVYITKWEAKQLSELIVYTLIALMYQLQADFLSFHYLADLILSSLPAAPSQPIMALVSHCLQVLHQGGIIEKSALTHPCFADSVVQGLHVELETVLSSSAAAVSAVSTSSTTGSIGLLYGPNASGVSLPSSSTQNLRLHVNQQNLRRAWEASQRSTKEDWMEWMRRFSIELLRESPCAALRSCCSLAQAYNPLARALFNSAFVSCWNELYEQYQDYLVRALESAFQSETIPAEILQTLLNLAEFMEHDVEALPIDIRELGALAQKCHAYAKALHYKELEFHTSPSTCIEALISINNQLGLPEAAAGILKYAQQHHQNVIHVEESWLEKLQDWQEALRLYDAKLQEQRARMDKIDQAECANQVQDSSKIIRLDVQVCIGKMRCLEALGQWEDLAEMATQVWDQVLPLQQHGSYRQRNRLEKRMQQTKVVTVDDTEEKESSDGPLHASTGPNIVGLNASTSLHPLGVQVEAHERQQVAHRIAMLGAQACCCLSRWDDMAKYVDEATAISSHSSSNVNVLPTSLRRQESTASVIAATYEASGYSRWQFETDPEEFLFRSVLAVHRCQFDQAALYIDTTRKLLDTKLAALVGESYERAYWIMMTLQQLSELEEIIAYKKLGEGEAHYYKQHLIDMWHDRLFTGCKRDVNVWQQILAVRSIILRPQEDIESWLEFASLCRQSGNLSRSLAVFTTTLGVEEQQGLMSQHVSKEVTGLLPYSSLLSAGFGEKQANRVAFAYLKHLWAVGEKEKALDDLHQLVRHISNISAPTVDEFGVSGDSSIRYTGASLVTPLRNMDNRNVLGSVAGTLSSLDQSEKELIVKCHLKLAEWQFTVHEQQLSRTSLSRVLASLKLCTDLQPQSYKAWHTWALMNFYVVDRFNLQTGQAGFAQHRDKSDKMKNRGNNAGIKGGPGPYIASAIEGFFRSVALGRSRWAANVQQDILRVLTLWFAHGDRPEVYTALEQGFHSVSIETWLIVIPQLIARIHTPYRKIQNLLHNLLSTIGAQHPHALIYPLSVALKSPLQVRREAAEVIMNTMRKQYNELVEEALLVSRELIRIAILWHEMWHEGLEEASRLYFGERDVAGMVEVLEPLHQMMENGPETLREVSFQQAFGRELREAYEWLQRFLAANTNSGGKINNESDLNRAWDLYYHVFRRINKQLPQLTTLELQYVSPNLLYAQRLQLAVPGTYRAGHWTVTIESFAPTIQVITSKQRPRRITIVGSNGLEYMFLLKGHEDLRQDERVTQLFGLVNALLINDRTTSKKELRIHRYPVIPLSHNAGIVGWVPNCDTLHQSIRNYREARKILLNIEHRLMLQMAPDYDALTLHEKVEVFEYALENTAGQDLYKVLWLKSENSQVWLDRRTSYTRSLAVMSMVGYILGLGDRHPSNLMLHRFTGTIVHIDFGDCFEVAMQREKYPEKIPFRLTRMLTNAMEVSGIEGNFRFSCERVMHVLRENRHSLMAMLEAFVHDPLICWRLLAPTTVSPSKASVSSSIRSSLAAQSTEEKAAGSGIARKAVAAVPPYPESKLPPGSTTACKTKTGVDASLRIHEDLSSHPSNGDESNKDIKDAFVPIASHADEANVEVQIKDKKQENEIRGMEIQSTGTTADLAATRTPTNASNRSNALSPSLPVPTSHLPPRPSVSLQASSRPMSLSKAIAFTRTPVTQRSLKTDVGEVAEDGTSVEKVDHRRVKLHETMSSLAASITNEGQASLRQHFASVANEALQAVDSCVGEEVKHKIDCNDHVELASDAEKNVSIAALNRRKEETSIQHAKPESVRRQQSLQPDTPVPQSQNSRSVHTNRSHRERELVNALGPEGAAAPREALNEKAVAVIRRVQAKLTGRDFEGESEILDVGAQVQRLIDQATSHENLCQCYIGWCPFW
uniref:non-specific serine/threonine protein kinase n=1 Tax=Albugo laibachii Nc14 TaxID=890382 RepID=F0WDC4_9STRA|nr:PREDICTED: similar to fkbprapamycin associated protein putative [Albugo laibachii Nc14]|eukprot:CCA19196.1 PREDICTED: similar to fkbprapamycin associated protein putative [Albugo laibachii Nc14]